MAESIAILVNRETLLEEKAYSYHHTRNNDVAAFK